MINVDKIVGMVDEVEELEGETEGSTAYQISQVVNKVLEAMGAEDRVTPQTIYNLSYAGRINNVKAEKGTKVRYSDDEVENFVARFVKKYTK